MSNMTQGERLIRVETSLDHLAETLQEIKDELKSLRSEVAAIKSSSFSASLTSVLKVIKPYVFAIVTAYAIFKGVPPDNLLNILK